MITLQRIDQRRNINGHNKNGLLSTHSLAAFH